MIKILYAGRVSPIKDISTLQKAAVILKAKLTINSNYAYRDIAKLFKSFDVIVVPTLSKALDKVFLEGLACGVPTIGSDIGYPFMVELFPKLVFKATDVNDLIEKIRWHINNKNRSKIVIAKAKRYIEENFNLEKLMTKIVESFNE